MKCRKFHKISRLSCFKSFGFINLQLLVNYLTAIVCSELLKLPGGLFALLKLDRDVLDA
jgi:hypothetical protein